MYTLPFELGSRTTAARRSATAAPVPARSLACLNTHDMPLFAGWLRRRPEERRRLAAAVGAAKGARDRSLLRSALTWLARSRAALLMVNLEDLWLETEPQNVPGTTDQEHPNWRRRARLRLEEIQALIEVDDNLQTVARLRAPTKRRPAAAVAAAGSRGAGVWP